jgi:hypothetical protein
MLPTARQLAGKGNTEEDIARFQITFTTGMVIHPAKEFEGSYEEAKESAEAELEQYLPGTRHHIRIWRMDPGTLGWAPCDDEDFREC